MNVKAKLRFLRISPRKVRLVVDTIRGLDVEKALTSLSFLKKKAAKPVTKLLMSAIANAENNFSLSKENLYIEKVTVDQGPTYKRWMPRAYGRATTIRKKTSHVSVVLGEKVESHNDKIKKKNNVKTVKVDNKEKTVLKKEESNDIPKDGKKRTRQSFDKKQVNSKKRFLKNILNRKSNM